MPRVLACYGCNTLVKLHDPPAGITSAQDDPELVEITRRHEPHTRHLSEKRMDAGQVYFVDQATYDVLDIEKHVQGIELAKNHRIFKDLRDELLEDALSCWKQHKSPSVSEGCVDFRTDAKILGNGKRQRPEDRMYLCSGCPLGQEWMTDDTMHRGARRGHRGRAVQVDVEGRLGGGIRPEDL